MKRYRKRVMDSAYYWSFKDPEYLKLVVTTDIPDENNNEDLFQYGYRNEGDEENRKSQVFDGFVSIIEKKYGFQNNELYIRFMNL